MYSYEITINGKDVTQYACFPISGELALDTALDQAYIELKASPRKKPYRPFSKVRITPISRVAGNDNRFETVTYLIASDDVETVIKTNLSNHKILLVEETKELERFLVPGKSFIQPLLKDYKQILVDPTDLNQTPYPTINDIAVLVGQQLGYNIYASINSTGAYKDSASEWGDLPIVQFNGLREPGTNLPTMETVFDNYFQGTNKLAGYAILLIDLSTNTIVASNVGVQGQYAETGQTVTTPASPGSFLVYYIANFGTSVSNQFIVSYFFSTASLTNTQRPPLYVTNVVNQLLEIVEPIFEYQSPRFSFNIEDAERYSMTPCAELCFQNGATLRECLDEIAGLVHCITRLKDGVIYFDKLGDNNEVSYAGLGAPVSLKQSENVEKYASHLDCNIDNLMNMQSPDEGSIYDPFYKIGRTVRAETTLTDRRTTNGNCIIKTVDNIERPIKLTVFYNGTEYDITSFLYEEKEYQLLNTNTGAYPYAKSFALYYKQGQRNIYGLSFKPENSSHTIQAFNRMAIENIMTAVTEQSFSPWFSDGTEVLSLAFNVQYITGVNGRVRQCKKNISDISALSAIPFNQFAPKVSSVNLGRRLRGEMAMLSEPALVFCFKTANLDAVLTSIGKLYKYEGDNYYVSSLKYTIWPTYVMAELTMTQNFNQLGRFVSINNAYRQFEIPTTSTEMRVVYEDYAVFDTKRFTDTPTGYNIALATTDLRRCIINSFIAVEHTEYEIATMANVTTQAENLEVITSLHLPARSLSLGNSIVFNFTFEDNYSAGEYLSDEGGYKLTHFAKYGDSVYGEAKFIRFSIHSKVLYTGSENFGDKMPLSPVNGLNSKTLVSTGIPIVQPPVTFPLILNKSAADTVNYTYQLHYVSKDPSLIFGDGLTKLNTAVCHRTAVPARVLLLPFYLNELNGLIIRNYDTLNSGYEVASDDGAFQIVTGYPMNNVDETEAQLNGVLRITELVGHLYDPQVHKSWAIVHDNNFMIGANGEPKDIYIQLRHNIPTTEEE